MKIKITLLTAILAFFLAACSGSGPKSGADDASSADAGPASGETVIQDADFEKVDGPQTTGGAVPENRELTGPDGSQIHVSFDPYGNKTETRCFNSSRLKCLVLLTKASGEKEISVFGQHGQTKTLPEHMIDKAMTASADEIADAAGIYRPFKSINRTTSSQSSAPLRPMPSSDFSVQVNPVQTEQPQQQAETTAPNNPVSPDEDE